MANKKQPVITHVEILCRAIRSVEEELKSKTAFMGGIPECETALSVFVNEQRQKLDALKEMYRIETGTNYD